MSFVVCCAWKTHVNCLFQQFSLQVFSSILLEIQPTCDSILRSQLNTFSVICFLFRFAFAAFPFFLFFFIVFFYFFFLLFLFLFLSLIVLAILVIGHVFVVFFVFVFVCFLFVFLFVVSFRQCHLLTYGQVNCAVVTESGLPSQSPPSLLHALPCPTVL